MRSFFNKTLAFMNSIYGRVVFIIALLSLFLFLSFGIIFRTVYKDYLNTVILQNGNNVGSLVEGALYHSMLTNDKGALQNTLDVINTMPGIDEVNMYDNLDRLVYSSVDDDRQGPAHPDCISCHNNLGELFPLNEKAYRIVDAKSACKMNQVEEGDRQLLIRSPIFNERSCYTSACHAHSESEQVLGSLIITVPLAGLDSAVRKSAAEFFILATIATVLMAALLIMITNRNIRNPLKAIVRASEAVAAGDRSTRIVSQPGQLDDMRMVATAINNMLDNLNAANLELQNWSRQLEYKVRKKSEELSEIQNELIRIERIASLGKLSSSVAHEINNPLAGVLTYTKLVHKQLGRMEIDPKSKESMLKYLTIIEAETKRCGDIVKGLLDFSRKDDVHFVPRSLHKIIRETYELMSHQMKISGINFYTDLKAMDDMVLCSENQIKQACIAILVNSTEAVTENGEVIMRTFNPDPDHIRLEIADNGSGIAPGDLEHIFEPFFSAKPKASGIGLGLAIVHGIVQNHKARIEVDSELGKQTTMSITFPLVRMT